MCDFSVSEAGYKLENYLYPECFIVTEGVFSVFLCVRISTLINYYSKDRKTSPDNQFNFYRPE